MGLQFPIQGMALEEEQVNAWSGSSLCSTFLWCCLESSHGQLSSYLTHRNVSVGDNFAQNPNVQHMVVS